MENPRDRKLSDVEIRWVDGGREPQCQPDPLYPKGIIIDLSGGAAKVCAVELPYPARRCGRHELRCRRCGVEAAVTTAGRPDDPRVVKLSCYLQRYGVFVLSPNQKAPHP